jgi:hypothetical protein
MNIKDVYLGSKKVSEIFREGLGLEEDYFQHILQADDWTMMILSWAFIEACLNQAISAHLGNESLVSFVERLNIGGRTGKAELAYSLGLIGKEERNFIDVFSEVRNRFAHGVRRFKTTFDEYFADIDVAKYERALPYNNLWVDSSAAPAFANDKRTMILTSVVGVCVNLLMRSGAGILSNENQEHAD